jgi:hypothetical protein
VYKRTRAIVLNLLLAVYFVSAVEPSSFAQESKPSAAPSPPSGLPSLQAVKSCMNSAAGAECLDQHFRQTLASHSTMELRQLIERFEVEDVELRHDCHPLVHSIGRETFRLKGNIHEAFCAGERMSLRLAPVSAKVNRSKESR